MSFRKYLKYKTKYIELSKLTGGTLSATDKDLPTLIKQVISKTEIFILIMSYLNNYQNYTVLTRTDVLNTKINKFGEQLKDYIHSYIHSYIRNTDNTKNLNEIINKMIHIFIQIMDDSKITEGIMRKHIRQLQIFIDALNKLTPKEIIEEITRIVEHNWQYCLDNKAQADKVSVYIKSIDIPK